MGQKTHVAGQPYNVILTIHYHAYCDTDIFHSNMYKMFQLKTLID